MNAESCGPEAAPERLDATALDRLRQLDPDGKHGVVNRVLSTYENSLQRQMELASQAGQQGDTTAVANVAHLLKSSSAAVGALALSECCASLERRLRAGEAVDLGAEVENLLTQGARALLAVRAML